MVIIVPIVTSVSITVVLTVTSYVVSKKSKSDPFWKSKRRSCDNGSSSMKLNSAIENNNLIRGNLERRPFESILEELERFDKFHDNLSKRAVKSEEYITFPDIEKRETLVKALKYAARWEDKEVSGMYSGSFNQ